MLGEDVKTRRLYIVGFYLHKILDTAKLKSWKVNERFSGAGIWGGMRELYGMEMSYINYRNDYATVYIYQKLTMGGEHTV